MKKLLKRLLTILILGCVASGLFAAPKTDVYIGITSSGGKKLPVIAMPSFIVHGEETVPAAQTVYDTLRADILYARYFDIATDGPEFTANKLKDTLKGWNKQHANYLIGGDISYAAPHYTIKLYVYDVATQSPVFAKAFKGTDSSLRRVAHIASDQIIQTLTGHRGIADTKIAFSNNSTRNKEIYVVDYDGENLKKLTNDKSIALLPRWSKDGRIYYTTYRYRNPDIFAIDLKAGKIAPVIIRNGLSLIGGVSPDGKALVFTSSKGPNPSIYIYNLESGEKKQITNKQSVDGSPSYSPDGKFITFVSNRAGTPQIYVMELATGQTRPLTKNFNWSDSPQWSPTGEWIVFAGRESPYHPFDIFLVDLTGTQLRRLTTDSGSNEDPTWSPDGRFIAFTSTRDGGRRKLFVMDSDGSAPHLVADLPGDSFTPHWSF
ncbi:MAG: PD40 domain-containing protein [Elusimicrobiaceae bacterium]|nr:PD40 domain-containing protein [Elusimicrobiaceae bacterium]